MMKCFLSTFLAVLDNEEALTLDRDLEEVVRAGIIIDSLGVTSA